uniref:Tr-type G domain-containing protein n=1 Tax=Tetranychus urticae TaxID=32264 RepID=T1KTN5_TETUR
MSIELLKQQGAIIVGKEPGAKVDKDRAYRRNRAAQKAAAGGSGDNGQTETSNGETKEKIDEIPEGEIEIESSDESSDEEIENWEDLTEESSAADKEKKEKELNKANNKLSKETKEPLKPVENKVNDISNKSGTTLTSKGGEPDKTIEQPPSLRSPVICVLGHVDTGKTKILDYIRKTHVQDNEAGGITQQIGATFVPPSAIHDQCKIVKDVTELKLPGLLIIDTPGHESFTNLRSRGSSLCDIAILVVDIMHGLEAQTIESINLLKSRKTPFIIALNKIDRLYGWKSNPRKDVEELIKSQASHTRAEFEQRATKDVILAMNENELNAALYYNNPDPKTYVSMVPTSAHSGDGMGNLINLIVFYCQERLKKRLQFDPDKLQATVLEADKIKKDAPAAGAAAVKKGPGAEQLALIKEQLKKQEEEERLKKEEEERIRREEEAERERLEKLRKEKEKKEKKKQKEKGRNKRLKKEIKRFFILRSRFLQIDASKFERLEMSMQFAHIYVNV